MNIKENISLNMFFSALLQVVEILSTLIIPRLIIVTFGSEVNGLVSSLNQFLNYVSLLEGGVASVMMANMYKPLLDNNNDKLSAIFATMQKFFRQISYIFVVYMLIVAITYPYIVHSKFSWGYIFSLTLILGITLYIKYTFSISYRLLLNADNKIYITAIIQIIVVVLNVILVYITIKIFPSIHLVKLISSLILLLQPIGYRYFVNKYFNIDYQAKPDKNVLSQRWNGFAINIAYFVHSNTDVVVLSIFNTLSIVSVYSVYLMVFKGVQMIYSSLAGSLGPILGKKIATGNKNELNEFFDLYEFFCISLAFILYGLAWIVIIPFVKWYTMGVTEINYIQPLFATILASAELVYCARDPYISLEYCSNKFREIGKYAYTEAIINIVISIVAVIKFGLVGVALGTLIGMIYRAIASFVYMKENLLNRSGWKVIKYWITFILMVLISYTVTYKIIQFKIFSFPKLIITGIVAAITIITCYFLLTILFHRKMLKRMVGYILNRNL